MAVVLVLASLSPTTVVAEKPVARAWAQWGGPKGDFSAPVPALATGWPEDGPEELWSRPLGDGYSAILYQAGRLYTMYRADGKEIVVCLDAATGETLWERRDPAPPERRHNYGSGPSSTPALAGERLFTIGIDGKIRARRKADGAPLWSHELLGEDFGGNERMHGYTSSPTVFESSVIVPVGGERAGLVALDQKTGRVLWRSAGFENSYSSPRVVEVAGERQILVFTARDILGVDPTSGKTLWSYPHGNQWGSNISMPVVAGDIVFISSLQAGARGLRLSREGGAMKVEEIWATRRVQLYHVSSVLIGDWVYGSSGSTSPAFLTAVNVRTGEIAWRERGFAKANCLEADGKLLILDEDGVLYFTRATPEGVDVLARTQLLDRTAWTVPTVVDDTLYARDRERIVAIRLGE